jgi:hypothetical protein
MKAVLWTLVKDGHLATAIVRGAAGTAVELRFMWDGELRESQKHSDATSVNVVANEKRNELLASGWVDAPSHLQQRTRT